MVSDPVLIAEVLPRILSAVFVEGLVHGNLTSQEALSLGHKVRTTLATAPISADDRLQDRVLQLPPASLCHRYQIHCHALLLSAQCMHKPGSMWPKLNPWLTGHDWMQ